MRIHWKNSLTYKTLKTISDILDGVYDVLPKHKSLYQVLYMDDKRKLYQSVNRLKEKKYIREEDQDGEKIFSITEKGKRMLAGERAKEKSKESWDRHWRLVIFDIPADKRNKRDFFRKKIKELGFLQY